MLNFTPEITIPYILAHVSEEEIYEAFGLRVQHGRFTAPYRKDRRPDCRFYRSPRNGKLYMRDYAGYFHGDCFDYVQFTENCGFSEALYKIAGKFKLSASEPGMPARKPAIQLVKIQAEECTIRIKRMAWTPAHKDFWRRWDFKDSTLDFYKISPVERVWLNEKPVFWYGAQKEIAFAYWFGDFDYKVYFPTRNKHRFLHNNASLMQGWEQLPESGPFCIITKSLKDCAKLYEFSIPATSPMAETQIPDPSQINELRQRFPRLFSLYDIDRIAGVHSMQKLKKQGVTPLFFPRGMPKDFTDFYEKFRFNDTKILIEQVMDYHL